ncbi:MULTISPECIES: hypothetical protein [unclassified Bradyrhizobium]
MRVLHFDFHQTRYTLAIVSIDARLRRMTRGATGNALTVAARPRPFLNAHQLLFDLHQYSGGGLRIETTFQSSSDTWQMESLDAR